MPVSPVTAGWWCRGKRSKWPTVFSQTLIATPPRPSTLGLAISSNTFWIQQLTLAMAPRSFQERGWEISVLGWVGVSDCFGGPAGSSKLTLLHCPRPWGRSHTNGPAGEGWEVCGTCSLMACGGHNPGGNIKEWSWPPLTSQIWSDRRKVHLVQPSKTVDHKSPVFGKRETWTQVSPSWQIAGKADAYILHMLNSNCLEGTAQAQQCPFTWDSKFLFQHSFLP